MGMLFRPCSYQKLNPDVMTMQSAEMRDRVDGAVGLNGPLVWRAFIQRQLSTCGFVVADIGLHHSAKMTFSKKQSCDPGILAGLIQLPAQHARSAKTFGGKRELGEFDHVTGFLSAAWSFVVCTRTCVSTHDRPRWYGA